MERELCILPMETITAGAAADEEKAEQLLAESMEGFSGKIAVLDDDPTGVQTVHDVSVYTDWETDTLRQGMEEESSMFFVLTNSRSFSEERTAQVHREIAGNLSRAAAQAGKEFMIISRGIPPCAGTFHWKPWYWRTLWSRRPGSRWMERSFAPFSRRADAIH